MQTFEDIAETIEIPISKIKVAFLLTGALLFVALGLWFVIRPEDLQNSYRSRPIFPVVSVGYASILFFGFCAIFFFKKLFDTKAGVIINDKGIIDNSSGVSAGFIPWSDITNISTMEISRQKLIMIEVKNPGDYINRQTGFIAKKAATINHKMYGTPISMTAGGLKLSFDDLYYALRKRWEQNTSTTNASSSKDSLSL